MSDHDGYLINQVARDYLTRMGPVLAVAHLSEQAGIAEGRGDELSATAWRDIAQAARGNQPFDHALPDLRCSVTSAILS